jgi:NADPH2:quinone reductase
MTRHARCDPFKRKRVSVDWEFMFTRSMFATADMGEQGALLNEVAKLVDAGTLRTTLTVVMESGRARGKIILEGF